MKVYKIWTGGIWGLNDLVEAKAKRLGLRHIETYEDIDSYTTDIESGTLISHNMLKDMFITMPQQEISIPDFLALQPEPEMETWTRHSNYFLNNAGIISNKTFKADEIYIRVPKGTPIEKVIKMFEEVK